MTDFDGKVAVVTGAAAGMGRSLAIQLAERGASVAICDVDPAGLAETERRCRRAGAAVEAAIVDMAEREAVSDLAATVQDRFGCAHYVFNNAGIGYAGTVERSEYKDVERVMDIDFWGVVHGTKAFLPLLEASGDGHLVNTSSIFGLFSVPGSSAYNAAKFAVRGYTEALRQEMLMLRKPVTVTCVHPGFIRTDIAKNATSADGPPSAEQLRVFDRLAITSADAAALKILTAARKGQPKLLIGLDAVILDLAVRLLGHHYQWPLAKLVGRLARSEFLGTKT
ncbi:MAG: SDR family NAD(P)-dependent oxidoreductase [Mycolicibacter algericus]|uniref:SDR family NAD(P)-dependent oxidoreductase n=1 Tax=Mycolicibacter algericus TaxID=1288388 RepID=UPI003C71C35D